MIHNEQTAGHLHPMTAMIRELTIIFKELGFAVEGGPELETEFYNFDALNVAKDHPSRDMQDTFWIKPKKGDSEKKLLRTQTSSVQIRYMDKMVKGSIMPPYRIVVPSKVFRNESTDATHEAQFFQMECLYIDENVSMENLKGTIEYMMKKLYGEDVLIRFRPSYFPFVEPAVEVDMRWNNRWLEMGGAGIVHPNVLKEVGLDSKKYRGFAFGFGIDRLVMLKHKGIDDIRNFYNGDLRFVDQF
jgi:phenylalanyl-tRNA synthetase alpha chain